MRNKLIFTATTLLLINLTTFAQKSAYHKQWYKNENNTTSNSPRELNYEVHGNYNRSVTKEKLMEAKLLRDIIPNYPVNWITDYVSVEITATSSGKSMNALNSNEALSAQQKYLLSTVDLGTGFTIKVKYKSKNAVTNDIVNDEMNVAMMIVPETEAEYAGGDQQLKKYLKESVVDKISESSRMHLQDKTAIAVFTINEQGEISNTKISETSGDAKTDRLIINAINKMSGWKPAENSSGTKVKQEFMFIVGNSGC
jgi:hypothetical protein